MIDIQKIKYSFLLVIVLLIHGCSSKKGIHIPSNKTISIDENVEILKSPSYAWNYNIPAKLLTKDSYFASKYQQKYPNNKIISDSNTSFREKFIEYLNINNVNLPKMTIYYANKLLYSQENLIIKPVKSNGDIRFKINILDYGIFQSNPNNFSAFNYNYKLQLQLQVYDKRNNLLWSGIKTNKMLFYYERGSSYLEYAKLKYAQSILFTFQLLLDELYENGPDLFDPKREYFKNVEQRVFPLIDKSLYIRK